MPERFEILTPRLSLRVPRDADAPDMAAIFGDMRVMTWLDRTKPETPDQILERARRHRRCFDELGYCLWLARRRDTGVLVGDCGVIPVAMKGPETEIGWRFAPDHWGHGYATEAARGVLGFVYTHTALDRIIAVTRRDNSASQRIMQKLGMTDRGTGIYYGKEQVVYDITRAGWCASGPPPAAPAARRP